MGKEHCICELKSTTTLLLKNDERMLTPSLDGSYLNDGETCG